MMPLSSWLQIAALSIAFASPLIAETKIVGSAAAQTKSAATPQAGGAANPAPSCSKSTELMAYSVSRQFVTDLLISPSTANFQPGYQVEPKVIGNCKYRVVAHVDSQNGFGAMIRTKFVADLSVDPTTEVWTLVSVNLHK